MLKKLSICAVAFFLSVFAIYAQTATGTILGSVSDPSGAVIPNASVTISNKATGIARNVKTNDVGLFSAPALQAGDYEVRGEAGGFRTTVREASVLAGSDTTVNLSLAVGTSQEVVTVEAATAQINYDSNTVAGSVQNTVIAELPLNGRNFLQLASVEPGVTVSAGATSARNGPIAVSVLGGGTGTTRYTLDGLDMTDHQDGTGVELNFSQEMVQEFQLQSVNFDLATGVTSTGSVNIISRAGGNDFHGSGFFFFRDHNLSAYPALVRSAFNPNPYFTRKDPGMYVAGPLIKNQLFFFFNYEVQNQIQALAVQPDLAAFAPLQGIFASPQKYHWANIRLDQRISDKNSAFLRYTHDGNTGFGPNGGANPEPSNWLNNDNWADQFAVGLTTTLTPNLVNDFRFGFTYWVNPNEIASSSQCQSPCVGSGLFSTTVLGSSLVLGNNYNNPISRVDRTWHLADSVSWQKGTHRMRFGTDDQLENQTWTWDFCDPGCLNVVPPTTTSSLAGGAANVATYFPTLPSTISTTADILNLPVYNQAPALYGGFGIGPTPTPGPYNGPADSRSYRFHVYAQDTWKVRPNLTVNYGLGYVLETGLFNSDLPKPQYLAPILPSLAPTARNQLDFAPAFGFAWSPGKSGKTVIRGGAGLYWDTLPFYPRQRENAEIGPLGNGRVTVTSGVFSNTIPGAVQFVGGQPVALPIGAPLPVLTLTNITLGQFTDIYNSQIGALTAKLSPKPQILSGPYTTTALDVIKNGGLIYPSDYPLMRSYQTSIGVQRDLGHRIVVTADWARRQFENVSLGTPDLNHYSAVGGPVIPKCTAAQQFVVGQECSTGGISVYVPEGRSIYEGLLVKVNKNMSNRYQFVVSYALQNLNSVSVVNYNNYFQGYGPTLPRHNLNVAGLVRFPWGFDLSVNSSIISAPPITATVSGIDLSGTGAVASGPLPGLAYGCLNEGCGKDDLAKAVADFNTNYAGKTAPNGSKISTLTLPANYSLGTPIYSQDFRLTKNITYRERYKLAIMGEFFNAFNIANLTGFSYAVGPSFGQPTQRASQTFLSGGPRAVQVGARVSF